MTGSSPYPPGYGAPRPENGPPQPGPAGVAYGQLAASHGGGSSRKASTGLLASGVVLAVLLGVAALVVSIVAVTQEPASAQRPGDAQAPPQLLFVDDADKALCEAIGPLLREETDRANAFLATGDPDSPERRAAIPKFKAETLNWANRVQALLNEHANPPRYLTRTVQQYIDGMLLYSENLHDDRGPDAFDKPAYDAAVVAAGGPLATCYKVGAGW